MKTHPGTGHPFKIALAGTALILCIVLVYVPAGCKQNGTTDSEQEEEETNNEEQNGDTTPEKEPDDNGSDTPPDDEQEDTEPEPEVSIYRQFLIDNPEASEGFTQAEYDLAEELLERAPAVMNDPEFYEGLNASIKGLTLDSSIELDWNNVIMPLWGYLRGKGHYGITILKLDDNYDLSKQLEICRRAHIEPEILTKEQLVSERTNLE